MNETIIPFAILLTVFLTCPSLVARDPDQVPDTSVKEAGSNAELTAHPEAKFERMTPAEIEAFERDMAVKLKRGTMSRREICDFALLPPILNTNPLPEYDYNRISMLMALNMGLTRTPKGRIWALWVAGEDGPKAFVALNRSEPDGETFSKPMLVINMHKEGLPPVTTLVCMLWTDPSGRLWLFFNQSVGQSDGREGNWVTICENPDGVKPEWSKPRRISHGVVNNKPTILKNGEWILPVQYLGKNGRAEMRKYIGEENPFPELDKYRGVNLLVSKDQGNTWTWRSTASFPNSVWTEPMVVELTDGRVWLLARTKSLVMQRFSSDGGRTWTEPSLPTFRHPRSRFFIRRLASGRILLIKHGKTIDGFREGGRYYERSDLTAWLSEDEGMTWRGGLMLDGRRKITYPDGFQAPDGTIHISYDFNRARGTILMARFTEADVMAGKLVSPRARLRMVIKPRSEDVPDGVEN